MKTYPKISYIVLFVYLLVAGTSCSGCQDNEVDIDKMSEMEQMKYDNVSSKLDALSSEVQDAQVSSSEQAVQYLYDELSRLDYDYNPEGMGERAQKKCQALKDRLSSLQAHPENLLWGEGTLTAGSIASDSKQQKGRTLLSKKSVTLDQIRRYPYYFKSQDKLHISLTPQGNIRLSLFDIDRKKCLKQWQLSEPIEESVTIATEGIYMVEVRSEGADHTVDITLSYEGVNNIYRPQVSERIVSCKKGDFLAESREEIRVSNVFNEPKKIGLRGNIKSLFSGKSRALISVPIPSGSDAICYSLRISTNEKTVSSDGNFANNLTQATKDIKILGLKVYERRSISRSIIIDRLLFNTRPPREEDAYCNMYVLSNATQAKKFQDETASSSNYKYDVDQSQMGTQSCNGQLDVKGRQTIYLGFENESMRYDNYIWLEVASLTLMKEYYHPVYTVR